MLFLVFAPLYQVEHYIKKLIVAKILPRHHQFVFAFNENWILCNVISFLT